MKCFRFFHHNTLKAFLEFVTCGLLTREMVSELLYVLFSTSRVRRSRTRKMKEHTIKLLAVAISILTLPFLYVATEEKSQLTIAGTVIEKKFIKHGEILTILTPLDIVLYTNTSIHPGQTLHAQGRITPYRNTIEFIADTYTTP